jgi:hypothetical protein
MKEGERAACAAARVAGLEREIDERVAALSGGKGGGLPRWRERRIIAVTEGEWKECRRCAMNASRLQTRVQKDGRLRLPRLPLRAGTTVEVIILEQETGADELLQAAESSLSFWDNPVDDEVWNEA